MSKDTIELTIVTREGKQVQATGKAGMTVMEVIRDGNIAELLALCGGCASCGTCHVHVDPVWIGRLQPMNGIEDDLLSSSSHRTDTSRLSCQIPVTEELDGLRVTIAPED